MALTRDFIDTIKTRAESDPEFRRDMLARGIGYMLGGDNEEDINLGKLLIRDYINATLGFDALAARTAKKKESLMRMLSASGNPSLTNLNLILAPLLANEGMDHPFDMPVEAAE